MWKLLKYRDLAIFEFMEINFTRGYFPAYSAGIFHFCTGDYLGSISQFFGSRNPGAGSKLGKYASGEQTCFFKGALDDVMSGDCCYRMRAEPESFGRRS